jgi:sec-independent protein translocase protein TatC
VGIAEIAFAIIAGVPGALLLAIARRRGWAFGPAERRPLPIGPVVGAAIAALACGAAGVALGFVIFEPMLSSLAPEGVPLATTTSYTDALAARLRLGLVSGLGLALPGAGAFAALLGSRHREVRGAVLFGLSIALGFGAGVALGFLIAPRAIAALYAGASTMGAPGGLEPAITLVDLAAALAASLAAFGLAGALLAGAAAAASRSGAAFRNALVLSGIVPGGALFFAGILTPGPDLLSQLVLALVLLAAWGAGLAAAAVVRALRRGRS